MKFRQFGQILAKTVEEIIGVPGFLEAMTSPFWFLIQ